MARIDRYLSNLTRLQALSITFTSDSNVAFRFPQGERMATQTTPHAELLAMIEEIATPAARTLLRVGGKATFGYAFDGTSYRVTAEPRGATMRLHVEPGEVLEEPELPPRNASTVVSPTMSASRGPASSGQAPTASPPSPPAPLSSPAPPPPAYPSGAAPSMGAGARLVDSLLVQMRESGASDLHLSSGVAPMVRLHGEMKPLPGRGVLSAEQLLASLYEITPEKNRKEFEERSDTDFAHMIPGVSRFRANLFRDRHGPGAVFRAIPFEILSPEKIGLPKKVLELCFLTKGLVVVTGPTGSGKSTTLATMIDFVNSNRHDHIITIEDPIEFVHDNKNCLVNQREVHTHTRSFKDALRAALREDPDIVLVGEMRDLETIAIAVETAETGHLVFGTLHTTTAPSTVDRIIDQFPADRQDQIRQMLSESLRGVIAQTLCKKIGGGRVAAYEVLLGSTAVSNLIRERKTYQLFSLMQTGKAQGMVTLNDSLLDLVKKGLVEPKEAFMKSVNKSEFQGMLQRENITLRLES